MSAEEKELTQAPTRHLRDLTKKAKRSLAVRLRLGETMGPPRHVNLGVFYGRQEGGAVQWGWWPNGGGTVGWSVRVLGVRITNTHRTMQCTFRDGTPHKSRSGYGTPDTWGEILEYLER